MGARLKSESGVLQNAIIDSGETVWKSCTLNSKLGRGVRKVAGIAVNCNIDDMTSSWHTA